MLISSVFLFIILIIILFRSCDGKGNVISNQKYIDSLENILKVKDDQYKISVGNYQKKEDSLLKVVYYNKRSIDSVSIQFKKVSGLAKRLIVRGDSLLAALDTLSYIQNCDSMSAEVYRLEMVAQNYIQMYEELEYNMVQQLESKDSIISIHAMAYADAKKINDHCILQANKINAELKKVTKQKRFNKTLTRILAGIAIGLGAIAAAK